MIQDYNMVVQVYMTKATAAECCPRGADADPFIAAALASKRIRIKGTADDIRKELKETGGWDAEELADDAQNRARIAWIAANDILEYEYLNGRELRKGWPDY